VAGEPPPRGENDDGEAFDIDPARDCFDCHTQVQERDYVFARPRNVGALSTVLGATQQAGSP
jgi:hypothetical protein